MKKLNRILILSLAVIMLLAFNGCTKDVDKSEKNITVVITYSVTSEKPADTYTVTTNGVYAIDALNQLMNDNEKETTYDFEGQTYTDYTFDFTFEGTWSATGLYINTINGVTADWNRDKSFWSININDDYAMRGISSLKIADGDKLEFIYTIS